MRRTLFAAIIAAAVVSAGVRAGAAPDSDAGALVQAALTAGDHLTYIGESETLRFHDHRTDATIVRIEHRPPDFTRRWYLAPPALFGDSIVAKDHATFEFDSHRRVLILGRRLWHDSLGEKQRLNLIKENYRAELGGESEIAGRRVRQISLLQRESGQRVVSMWIDNETKLPLERESYNAEGSISYRMRFTSLRYVHNLPPEIFSTVPPPGYAVEHHGRGIPDGAGLTQDVRPAPHDVQEPRRLPLGFVLIGVSGENFGGRIAHYMYSDGIRVLSLFSGPAGQSADFPRKPRLLRIGRAPAHYLENGSDGLLHWQNGNRSLTLVGSLSPSELINIAKAL